MVKNQRVHLLPKVFAGFVVAGLLGLSGAVLYPLVTVDAKSLSDEQFDVPVNPKSEQPKLSAEEISQVRSFCGDCHATPEPDLFPKNGWHAEVVRGYRFYAESGRHDLDPPAPSLAVRYYVEAASDELEMRETIGESSGAPQPWFESEPIRFESPLAMQPGVGCLKPGFVPGQILAADMVSGNIWLAELKQGSPSVRSLARLHYPCRIEWGDVDGDDAEDLLVADLGVYYADDRQDGSVSWMRRLDESKLASPQPLLQGIGRACDIRVGDFNHDGLPDVVAAEFGWLKTGGIHLLVQTKPTTGNSSEEHRVAFEPRVLDKRAGAVHLLPVDLDHDQRLDLLALFGQQYESIEWFQTSGEVQDKGAGSSEALLDKRTTLFQAPDPGYGSSGIEHVDFDGDGDLDLLYSHGDTFDGPYVKPSHGVHWLENKGNQRFEPHRLVYMAGAYSATMADWDEDGDLDVAISAWLPSETRQFDRTQAVSVLLLERVAENNFKKHVLERGNPVRASLLWVDIDQDGDLDLAASRDTEDLDRPVLIDCWLNRLR